MANDKICALMRQSWYEAAVKNLKDGERLCFYELCFRYEFYGEEPENPDLISTGVMILFDVAKEALQMDMEKAQRISMRNRRNGILGGRPKTSENDAKNDETQQNPTKPKRNPKNPDGFFGLPYTYNTTNNTTNTLHVSAEDFEKRERFLIGLIFFSNGAPDVARELEKFYNYYDARGWEVSKGLPVRDRVALARTWRIEGADGRFVEERVMYAGFVNCLECDELELLTKFHSMEVNDNEAVISLNFYSKKCMELLEEKYIRRVVAWFNLKEQQTGKKYQLKYSLKRQRQRSLDLQ